MSDESLLEILEDIESDESDESDEAWDERRRRRARVRPGAAGGRPGAAWMPRPTTNNATYVTQAQLQSALEKVGQQVGRNASAIRALDVKAEARADRADKAIASLRRDLRRSTELSALMPLLMQKTATITLPARTIVDGQETTVPKEMKVMVGGDSFSAMLPLVLMGGLGGSGSGSGDDNNNMMMLALVMAMGK
jgi:hypothetical protein